MKRINLIRVTKNNRALAKRLQAMIFPNEKSPLQIDDGIISKNPENFICFNEDNIPVGIVGFYFLEHLPDHVLLNWFGILDYQRKKGYGKEVLLNIIEYCKTYYKDKKYLTYYTDKYENMAAISLYNNIGFITKDYCCKQDIQKLNMQGIENTFVIGVLPLVESRNIDFSKINMNISEQYEILNIFN